MDGFHSFYWEKVWWQSAVTKAGKADFATDAAAELSLIIIVGSPQAHHANRGTKKD